MQKIVQIFIILLHVNKRELIALDNSEFFIFIDDPNRLFEYLVDVPWG